ncbi:MAG TPA: hypothetical protein DDY13_01895 [Cytophagales bacterium]|jgi:serine protease Do|nr:hypothetical protein [Cytophagales bacterium]
MKRFALVLCYVLLFTIAAKAQLNTKQIAARYGKGVVKVILFDPNLEKVKPGAGYLSRGSGFFVTDDGYLFTNRHVVEKCVKGYVDYDYYDKNGQKRSGIATYSEDFIENLIKENRLIKAYNTGYTVPVIQVFNGPGENDYVLYDAEVISVGMGAYDGALLRVVRDEHGNTENLKFTALPIGDSDRVAQGEQLCVFGYPAQFNGSAALMLRDMSTLSLGIMSGLDYVFNPEYGFIKTDAEIHPGNSGGPVFNEQNRVIGIATSVGLKTGVGLVGGINGMYYVSAVSPEAHNKLEAKGLNSPQRAFSIQTTPGNKLPIKSPEEINAMIYGNGSNPTVKKSTSASKVFFSNISVTNNNNTIPGTSKRYSSFTIDRKNGGVVYVYVDTYPDKLGTDKIVVLIDRKKGDKYEKYEDLAFNVTGTLDYTYFPYTFTKKGDYKITIYSGDLKVLGSGFVSIGY